MKNKTSKKVNKVKIVYGGPCYVTGEKQGFVIFHKENGKYRRMAFSKGSQRLWDKTKGGIYEIDEVTENGAKFGSFTPTGETCEDKEVKQQIEEAEVEYENTTQNRSIKAAMKKHETSFKNKTLTELKEIAKNNWQFRSALKQWVNNNF